MKHQTRTSGQRNTEVRPSRLQPTYMPGYLEPFYIRTICNKNCNITYNQKTTDMTKTDKVMTGLIIMVIALCALVVAAAYFANGPKII